MLHSRPGDHTFDRSSFRLDCPRPYSASIFWFKIHAIFVKSTKLLTYNLRASRWPGPLSWGRGLTGVDKSFTNRPEHHPTAPSPSGRGLTEVDKSFTNRPEHHPTAPSPGGEGWGEGEIAAYQIDTVSCSLRLYQVSRRPHSVIPATIPSFPPPSRHSRHHPVIPAKAGTQGWGGCLTWRLANQTGPAPLANLSGSFARKVVKLRGPSNRGAWTLLGIRLLGSQFLEGYAGCCSLRFSAGDGSVNSRPSRKAASLRSIHSSHSLSASCRPSSRVLALLGQSNSAIADLLPAIAISRARAAQRDCQPPCPQNPLTGHLSLPVPWQSEHSSCGPVKKKRRRRLKAPAPWQNPHDTVPEPRQPGHPG